MSFTAQIKKRTLIAGIIVAIIGLLFPALVLRKQYVTGEYALYCYIRGEEPSTIKRHYYFRSLDECGKPLKQ